MATGKGKGSPAATGAGAEFLQELGRRGHDARLAKARGTLRFDIVDGKRTAHWLIELDRGDVAVSHRMRGADCVVRTDKATFDQLGSGANPFTALLRGEVTYEGDVELLTLFQRVIP